MKLSFVRAGALLLLLAGIFALAACGTTTTSTSNSTTPTTPANAIHVSMYNDHMTLSQSTFSAGMPYHFLMHNNGTLQQACAIVPHSASQMPMGMMQHHALMMTNVMMPGATKAFDYTFPTGMASQQLDFACYANGQNTMHMAIQVH
jgi:phosphopantothenoylcysteine synthetase/decarboxylase